MTDLERLAIVMAVLGAAIALSLAALICDYLDRRTQRRIWEDRRDLSELKPSPREQAWRDSQ